MIDWILTNWDTIFKWIGLAVTFSSAAVKGAELTKTAHDDNVVSKTVRILDILSVFNTPENKAKIAKFSKKK